MSQSSVRSPVRRLIWPTIATLVVFAILCSLGTWQWRRMGWKEALIEHVDNRLKDKPVAAPGPELWQGLDLAEADYTPVTVSGTFLNDKEAHFYGALMQPRGPIGGPGWFVFTPLRTDDGWIVYVNRGFVPDAMKDAAKREQAQLAGRVTVTGLLRRPENPGIFQSSPNLTKNQWFAREPAHFAATAGLPADQVAPYSIDADATPNPGGLPQGGETTVTFSNNHLQYVVTWFGLAFALLGVYGVFVNGVLKRKD
ncbi:SURF1-like protein [Kaistia sp. 32K]|uniref:SURF1 family protein n=1 Tax=Kaistia sp. 32K TaxID=2795690 RepID=UPI00191605EF|nr:SURF1 family protein [Kaistia sp. 32K]BCP52575.1 SURF1-like protein [Kaistia sp. 32K]